jgi:Cyclin, N-terminal domain
VLILDIYASREPQDFDIWLAALGALLVSAKFVQMKYPSADSLNSATDNSYTYENIIQIEGHLLAVISWELLQYPIFEFLNFFLA